MKGGWILEVELIGLAVRRDRNGRMEQVGWYPSWCLRLASLSSMIYSYISCFSNMSLLDFFF